MSHHRDNMQSHTVEIALFITHIESDRDCLKIWAQQDTHAATCVDRFIRPLVEQFSQGYGCPSKSNPPIIGALCCSRFRNDGYYRAKIIDVRRDSMIAVQFIDYGNIEIVSPNHVHLLNNIPGSEPLLTYPALAADFILLNVLPVNGVWENQIIETIKSILCYNEYRVLVNNVANNRLIVKLWYNNEDFSNLLVKRNLALPANMQDTCRIKSFPQPEMLQAPVYQQQNEGNMNNFASMMQNANMNQNTNMQAMYRKTPPGVTQPKYIASQLSPPTTVQEALVFKSRVLDVGTMHEVLVSCVEDGPQKFSVQVQSTTEILTHLMKEINNRPKKPLQEPPLPGSVCLGYTEGRILCRAVVMSVMEHKCKLYYVDFGHTEVLPYTDIFQLPPEFINPKVLSIRFTLSGLKELNITQEMKDYFKKLVSRKLLYLQVRPPEGPPLIQYGDLYDNGVNIKDMLKKAFPVPAAVPITYSYPQLRRLPKDVQEIVQVSFVESCQKFFVQLLSGEKSLQSIMAGLAQYAKTASAFNISQLKAGLPCAALYESEWYRAQIVSVNGNEVRVVYVDYGNEETLSIMSLRTIHDDLVTKLPAQAIKCALNGYEVLSPDQEVINHFETLTYEKNFFMKVVASQPNNLLVDLFELDTMRSIHPQLFNNPFCDKTAENSTSSQNGEIQHAKTSNSHDIQRSGTNVQANLAHRLRLKLKNINTARDDKDKYNKKSNADSWNRNQNAKFSQENRPKVWKEKQTVNSEWSTEKQYDNRRERSASHFQRDNSQNDRFVKDETTNRSGRSYNKYDRTEMDTPNKNSREGFRSDKNRFPINESRFNRNNSNDKTLSDKDSDTSSKSNDNRGKGFNRNARGEKRDNGASTRLQTTKWNDRNNDRPSHDRSGRVNGNYTMGGNNFKNKENNANNISYNQVNNNESWDSNNASTKLQSKVAANKGSQFASMNITLGTVKNCEIVFTNSPSDFFIQLSPECLELESIMDSIAETYEKDGETMQAFKIKCGTCCVAQYEEDLKWYRAMIQSVEGNNATVKFIDYGNSELVNFIKIKVIQEEFVKLPMQAVQCKLLGLADNKEVEYATFVEKTEGKSLEVEFITEENGIYEVLLREIVEGVSNTCYINEEFCTSADLTKVKETALNKRKPNTTRKVHVVSDYAPLDSKWQTALYEPESKHDVIVTWFINPNKFYCQTLAQETEFKTMMNEIQKTYASREPIKNKLEVGSPIIAIFSEDKALYRAEVVSNSAQKGYIVQYIDFGNCATVKQHNIYPVEKRFMQLPMLAAQCTLKNIIPNKNLNWSDVNNDALDKCFDGDKYECTFHSLDDDQYTISLNYNGQDVGGTLVKKNLAVFAEELQSTEAITSTEAASVAPDTSNVKVTTLHEIERVDISLLSGQTLKMKVSSVESTNRFHVQLPSASKCEHIVEKYMADKNAEVMPRLSSREMCLGAGCLVNANGTWRRAVVINSSRLVGSYDVKLIDTGAYDEILDDALTLPGALAVMQKQALECSLQNVQASPDADKQLKRLIEGKEVLVYVAEINDSRLIVKLYDLHGCGIMNISESDKKISTVCPMPILSSTHKVSVSCAQILEDNSISIWLQRYSDYEADIKLLTDLERYYSNSGQRLKPEPDLLCAVKSTDDRWYRGKIVSCTETTAYVHYIDIGNTEQVAFESIMVLEPQFYEPHQLAVNASLSLVLVGTEAEQINVLQTHLINKELMAVFYNVRNKWIVDLTENNEKLSDRFRSLNLIKEEEITPQSVSQTQETPTTGQFDVYVSHVDSPNQFWLQRVNENAALTEIQDKLQLEVTNFPAIDSIPEEGTLCAAIYLFDENWYRAEVLDADEDITTVRFIDYGNTDVIDKAGHIRQLPDTWKNIKGYAVKCKLDVIPVGTEDWSQATCDRFGELVMSVDTLQATIVADTMPKRVELFIDNKSVSEILVEEKHAIIVSPEQAELVDEEIVDIELDPHSAFVSHINSPSEFWVQEEKSVADLEVMTDRFMVADMFPKIDVVEEGLLCVAKYPEDSQWYRARVLSNDDNGTQVIFVDYGNSSVSTEIRALPEDLADVPSLSRKCSLELPSHVEKWSEEACNKFIELAAEGATIFILDVIKEQETSIVKLTLDNENIADILASLCEQHSPVIEERLPPLGEENSPNVVVSHINSPDEFWIQAESSINELEVMSYRLRDAQSFVTLNSFDVGTVCAALYPEDECWYRAKVLACCEESTEVLYMDYGNSAVTDELRVLPQDIVNIPSLSKRCSLEKPHDVAVWSERACDKFKELAAEGATMFQFETLDKNDPMQVRLSLNGTNVVELLQAECENIPEVEVMIEDEAENTVSTTENQVEVVANETVFQEDHLIEKTSDLEHKLENVIDDDVINKSFGDSNIGEDFSKEQQEHMMTCDKNEKANEEFEVMTPEQTSEVNKVSEYFDTNATSLKESTSIVTDLSIDDIINNMVKDTTEDAVLQEINDVNLPVTNESQFVVQDDINEQQELATQVESIDINKPSDLLVASEKQLLITQDDVNEQQLSSKIEPIDINESSDVSLQKSTIVSERISINITENVTENSNSEKTLLVTNKSQDVPIDVDQMEKQEAQSEAQLNINESLERQTVNTTFDDPNIRCLSPKEQHINPVKELQRQSPVEDETACGSANKNDNLQVTLKSASIDQKISTKSTDMVVIPPLSSVTKTDIIEQRRPLSLRRRSEDKIVPGCISRGESPDPEMATYFLTPKMSASTASTLQSVADSAKEEDEILTVSVENIP
ncbi:maternal protein tudor-like isoform X3 [Odontomachus brunneus]|uniref:maternal protein tudor-like isoform X3 n=1 Tax=Odontomachus brunneus TaxID=486640 RepID=UPI0013F1C75F|nr:maternal protein tudor-like isoform X3 [Odontomachus brunneus]